MAAGLIWTFFISPRNGASRCAHFFSSSHPACRCLWSHYREIFDLVRPGASSTCSASAYLGLRIALHLLPEDIGHDASMEVVFHLDGGVEAAGEGNFFRCSVVVDLECDRLLWSERFDFFEGKGLFAGDAKAFPSGSLLELEG